MGFDSVQALATADEQYILQGGAFLTGSICWKKSPQAKQAARNAIDWASVQLENIPIE
ncbi:recombinase RecA [Lonepinella koalarum]|uniref:recombinase RecA n=1 Tax=Lonepinella koalarum TaxID=53417 RepID=UPI003F6E34C9